MEKGIHNFEAGIMKAFQSSPFAGILKEMLGNMAGGGGGKDGGKGPETIMSEIAHGLENTAKLFE